ncbi:hypothetical protein TH1_22135 [Thalassospira lucentensis MCCC 1A00383 = DSM 14000]|nr:hypothetical protein TH1_22135 [Thalassospira lucentensis MCCC 1A00383 = DSM 14000]
MAEVVANVFELPAFDIIFRNFSDDCGLLFIDFALAANGFAKLVEGVNEIVPGKLAAWYAAAQDHCNHASVYFV